MAAAQTGDREAYTRLLEELYPVIEAYLIRMLGPAAWIEDCVQDSLTAIHRARHSYDARRPLRPWLFTIVRHKAIDTLRRDARRPEDPMEIELEAPAEGGSVEKLVDAGRLLDRLSDPYREALILTKLRGYSIAEAAEASGVSASAMKARVHRAVRQLARSVESELEGI